MQPSRLLSLPAELRSQIWIHAYADQTITINDPDRPFPPGRPTPPRRLTYSLCGPSRGAICPHICPEVVHITAPWHRIFYIQYKTRKWHACPNARPFTHPLVSKQFWTETTAILVCTATWVFHEPHDLRQVLLSSGRRAWAPRIQRLVIRAAAVFSVVHFFAEWQCALTWRLLSTLKQLKGVEMDISLDYSSGHDTSYLCLDPDLVECRTWVKAGVPSVVRAFQQHCLMAEKTVVKLDVGELPDRLERRKDEAQAWCEALRNALLVFKPLGEGRSISERRAMREWQKRRGGQVEKADDG
jgi:hypothetical protein